MDELLLNGNDVLLSIDSVVVQVERRRAAAGYDVVLDDRRDDVDDGNGQVGRVRILLME